jgi:hypothetical protein
MRRINPAAGQAGAKPAPSRRRFRPRMLAVCRTAPSGRQAHIMSSAEMPPAENATPTPTRAQAEQAVAAMLDVSNTRGNLVTQLKVADYATWRTRFHGMEGARASTGIANVKVFRNSDHENALVILADIANLADALAWARGTAIPSDGMEWSPTVYFGTDPLKEQPVKIHRTFQGRRLCQVARPLSQNGEQPCLWRPNKRRYLPRERRGKRSAGAGGYS